MSQFLHPRDAASGSRSKSRPRHPRRQSSTSSQGSFTEAVTGRMLDTFTSVRDRFSRSRSRDRRGYKEGRADLPPARQGLATVTRDLQRWREEWVPRSDGRANGPTARNFDDRVDDWNRREHRRLARERQDRLEQERAERDRRHEEMLSRQHPYKMSWAHYADPPETHGHGYYTEEALEHGSRRDGHKERSSRKKKHRDPVSGGYYG